MTYPSPLLKLMQHLRKLPGVGQRSAERFAFQLVDWSPRELQGLAQALQELPLVLKSCSECGCLRGEEDCVFCNKKTRESHSLCVVGTARDVYPLEEMSGFRGHYHVLNALLSPMEGRGAEEVDLEKLRRRIQELEVEEVILALDSTLEGDATALLLKESLQDLPVKLMRLAFGIPMGSSLDYVDQGTLAQAFMGRQKY